MFNPGDKVFINSPYELSHGQKAIIVRKRTDFQHETWEVKMSNGNYLFLADELTHNDPLTPEEAGIIERPEP
jgi:hypothetical protein